MDRTLLRPVVVPDLARRTAMLRASFDVLASASAKWGGWGLA